MLLRTVFGGPLCAKKSRAPFLPQSAPVHVLQQHRQIHTTDKRDVSSKVIQYITNRTNHIWISNIFETWYYYFY